MTTRIGSPLRRFLATVALRRSIACSFSSRSSKRDEDVAFVQGEILFGIYPVMMALKAGRRKIHRVYFCPGSDRSAEVVKLAESSGVSTTSVTFASLDGLAWRSDKTRGVHQGVCADVDRIAPQECCKQPTCNSKDSSPNASGRPLLWLLLCGLRDPMNVGGILRSAYFLGVDRVLVTPQFPSAPLTPVVSKASAGVLEIFPPYVVRDLRPFLKEKRQDGWSILAAERRINERDFGGTSDGGARLDRPTILAVGSEGSGIPWEVGELCEQRVFLPPGRQLHEDVDSLNVSVATALLISKVMQTAEVS